MSEIDNSRLDHRLFLMEVEWTGDATLIEVFRQFKPDIHERKEQDSRIRIPSEQVVATKVIDGLNG